MTENEDFKEYLDRLRDLVYLELVPKVAVFDYYTREICKFKELPENVHPLLWFFQSGTTYDVVFSLYRLLDKNGERNIHHFLNVTEQNFKKIAWKKAPLKADFKKFRAELAQLEPSWNHLRTRRDKFFGHYDKLFFYDPSTMDAVAPFTNSDAIAIVQTVQRIVAHYCNAYFGSMPISTEGFYRIAAEKLYDVLRANKWGSLGPKP